MYFGEQGERQLSEAAPTKVRFTALQSQYVNIQENKNKLKMEICTEKQKSGVFVYRLNTTHLWDPFSR